MTKSSHKKEPKKNNETADAKETLPDLCEKMTYSRYYNLIQKGIRNIRKIKNELTPIEDDVSSRDYLSKEYLDEIGDALKGTAKVNEAYWGLVQELLKIANPDFRKNDYYYFFINNGFMRYEKQKYSSLNEDSAMEIKRETEKLNSLIYI